MEFTFQEELITYRDQLVHATNSAAWIFSQLDGFCSTYPWLVEKSRASGDSTEIRGFLSNPFLRHHLDRFNKNNPSLGFECPDRIRSLIESVKLTNSTFPEPINKESCVFTDVDLSYRLRRCLTDHWQFKLKGTECQDSGWTGLCLLADVESLDDLLSIAKAILLSATFELTPNDGRPSYDREPFENWVNLSESIAKNLRLEVNAILQHFRQPDTSTIHASSLLEITEIIREPRQSVSTAESSQQDTETVTVRADILKKLQNNSNLFDLWAKLNEPNPEGRSQAKIARDFYDGEGTKANSALRQLRRILNGK